MKKYIMITLGIMMCLTLVSAGLSIPVLMERYEKTTNLTDIQESRIKLSSNVSKIDVDISPIKCNNVKCYAKISQEGVIHTTWRRDKSYCSEYSECNKSEEFEKECQIECLSYADYTLEENQEAIKEFINKRLRDYADAEEVRKENNGVYEAKDVGGNLKSEVSSSRK